MELLPKELYFEIFSYLPQRHLRSLSQTCRAFASLAKPLMFESLHLSGDAQRGSYVMENGRINVFYPGRSRTVDLASLEKTVDELIAFDIMRHVRTIHFSPKYYVEGFWSRYRRWLENDQDYEADFYRMDGPEDFKTDQEGVYLGIRRLAAERLARPEKERKSIEKAEMIWTKMVEEQRQKAEANVVALANLFAQMPSLKAIEITQWSCDLAEYGIGECCDDEVINQFSGCTVTWKHLELLSSAIQMSNSTIKSLVLPSIDPSFDTINATLENVFSFLTALSFGTEDVDFMLESSNNPVTAFTALLRCASQTLQILEFRNPTASHPHMLAIGEHFLEKLFGESSTAGLKGPAPLVFPELKTLKLHSLILNTPSLITFVSRQSQLQYAYFKHVCIATIGYKWGDVAQKLPPSCNKLYIGHCRHEKYNPDSPAAYNHIKDFYPYKEHFPAFTGWELNESFFQKEMDVELQRQKDCGMLMLPPELMYQGQTRDEWVAKIRLATTHAEFQRTRRLDEGRHAAKDGS